MIPLVLSIPIRLDAARCSAFANSILLALVHLPYLLDLIHAVEGFPLLHVMRIRATLSSQMGRRDA